MESVGIILFNKHFGLDGIGRNYHYLINILVWMESVGIIIFNKHSLVWMESVGIIYF